MTISSVWLGALNFCSLIRTLTYASTDMLHVQPETKTFRVWSYSGGDSPEAKPIHLSALIANQSQRWTLGVSSRKWGCLVLSVCCDEGDRRVEDCFQRDEVIGFPGRGQVETQFFQLWNCLLSSCVIVRVSHFLVCTRYLDEVHGGGGVGSPSACFISETTEWVSIKFCRPVRRVCVERPRNRGSILSTGKLSSPQTMLKREYLYK
jgi:hypothetical protein